MDVFTVVQIGWEYNDEYYYTHEYEEGNPIIVYKSRDNAEKDCLKRNIDRYKGIAKSRYSSIGAFFQEWDTSDIDDDKPQLEKLGVVFDDTDVVLPQTQTDANWTLIISLLGIVFYKIEKLEFVE